MSEIDSISGKTRAELYAEAGVPPGGAGPSRPTDEIERALVQARLRDLWLLTGEMHQSIGAMPDAAGLAMDTLERHWNALSSAYDDWWATQEKARGGAQP